MAKPRMRAIARLVGNDQVKLDLAIGDDAFGDFECKLRFRLNDQVNAAKFLQHAETFEAAVDKLEVGDSQGFKNYRAAVHAAFDAVMDDVEAISLS